MSPEYWSLTTLLQQYVYPACPFKPWNIPRFLRKVWKHQGQSQHRLHHHEQTSLPSLFHHAHPPIFGYTLIPSEQCFGVFPNAYQNIWKRRSMRTQSSVRWTNSSSINDHQKSVWMKFHHQFSQHIVMKGNHQSMIGLVYKLCVCEHHTSHEPPCFGVIVVLGLQGHNTSVQQSAFPEKKPRDYELCFSAVYVGACLRIVYSTFKNVPHGEAIPCIFDARGDVFRFYTAKSWQTWWQVLRQSNFVFNANQNNINGYRWSRSYSIFQLSSVASIWFSTWHEAVTCSSMRFFSTSCHGTVIYFTIHVFHQCDKSKWCYLEGLRYGPGTQISTSTDTFPSFRSDARKRIMN